MQITRRQAIAGALGSAIAAPSLANEWPTKPIFWICPFRARGRGRYGLEAGWRRAR